MPKKMKEEKTPFQALERAASKETRRSGYLLILATALLLILVELYYYARGVPLKENIADWLVGMVIASLLIILAFYQVQREKAKLLATLEFAAKLRELTPNKQDYEAALRLSLRATGADGLAIYLPQGEFLHLQAAVGTCALASLPISFASSESEKKVGEIMGKTPGKLTPIHYPGSVPQSVGLLLAHLRRGSLSASDSSSLTLAAHLLASKMEQLNLERKLLEAATTDYLTGLDNTRQFMDNLSREIERARRYTYPLSLVAMDLDHLKEINDTHGHQAGDSLLKSFAEILHRNIRPGDSLARLGGDEFAIILPQTDSAGALEVAHRLAEEIAASPFLIPGVNIPLSASQGVASLRAEDSTGDDLLRRADKALYLAKSHPGVKIQLELV